MAAFAACVATWTRLETLVLIGALPHEPVVAPASPYPLHAPDLAHRIVLPRLRQIRISTDAATAVDQFLRYFVLPPHVSLYLDCELYDSPEIDSWGPREVAPTVVALSLLENVPAPAMRRVTDVFVFLNAHLLEVAGRVRPRDEEDMEDDDSDESNIDVDDDLENEVGHFSDPDGPLGTQLHVVLREPEDDDSDSDSDSDVAGPANTAAPLDLGAILAQLSLTHTTYIELNIDRALPRETWLRALAPMRRLEDLHFLSNGPEADSASLLAGFLDAFAGDGPDGEHDLGRDTEADWRSLLLPRLRLLSFPAANFSGAMWRRLGAALRRRREAGAQMQMLVVEECAGEEGVHRPDGRTLEELEELLEERVFWRTRKMVGSDCQSSEEGESEEEEVEDEGEEEEEEEEL
ncbi:hypothetical protein DENSPDRAFT_839067 [Dentipellis sp. KUC8613]|nr:hypothetical protein DENSPDRAFT_839067 [Dentipellis sp. KUC8613]